MRGHDLLPLLLTKYSMRCLLFGIGLLIGNSVWGQTYLDTTSPLVGGEDYTDLLVEGQNINVAVQSNINWKQLDIGRFDMSAHPLLVKSYSFPNSLIIESCRNCLQASSSSYFTGITQFFAQDSSSVTFLKLDAVFDTVLSRDYFFGPENNTVLIDAMKFDTDSTFISTGLVFRYAPDSTTFKYDLWVAKLDTSLNLIWEKTYKNTLWKELNRGFRGTGIVVDDYGSVLITGEGKYSNARDTGIFEAIVARINRTNGDSLWFRRLTGPVGSRTIYALDAGDGTYYYAENVVLELYPITGNLLRTGVRTGRLDTAGNVLSAHVVGPTDRRFNFHGLRKTLDGNLYVSGELKKGNFNNSAALKFTSTGDSLWYREYIHQDTADESYIFNFMPLPDSGFIHVGYWADLYNPVATHLYTWFLRTDKYGCIVQGCEGIGLGESQRLQEIEIFPNPFYGWVNIHFPNNDLRPVVLEVYDVKGLKVYSEQVAGSNQIRLDLRNLNPGVYILKILYSNQRVEMERLILEK